MIEKRAYSKKSILQRRRHYFRSVISFKNYRKKKIKEYINRTAKKKEVGANVLPRVVVSVGNFCSLQCKECSQLEPYKKNKCWQDINTIIDELDMLFSPIDECVCVDVIGGEPLLYKELPIVLKYLIDEKRVSKIEVTTNGTVDIDESVLQVLKQDYLHRTQIKISNYGAMSSKIDSIKSLCEENGIQCEIMDMDVWYGFSNFDAINYKTKKSSWKAKYQYFWCNDNLVCKMVKNGKLYMCGRASGLEEFGYELCEGRDYIVLRRGLTFKDLLNFWLQKQAPICKKCGDYCTDKMNIVEVAEQL